MRERAKCFAQVKETSLSCQKGVGFPKEYPHWLSETEAYNDMAFKELAENGN